MSSLASCQGRLPRRAFRFSLATWQLGLYSVAAYMLGGGPRCVWQLPSSAANDDSHETSDAAEVGSLTRSARGATHDDGMVRHD